MRPAEAPHRSGFSLAELLAAVALLALVLLAVLRCLDLAETAWQRQAADPFAEAGEAFEAVCAGLAGATLAPYADYADRAGNFRDAQAGAFAPDHPARRSDLAFACGPAETLLAAGGRAVAGQAVFFAAATGYAAESGNAGLPRLLNARGYFVEFADDPPGLFPHRFRGRWRLREVLQPAEALGLPVPAASAAWIAALTGAGAPVRPLADNVAALIVLPEGLAAETATLGYAYDSRDAGSAATLNRLPARLRVALAALDETSARRLGAESGTSPPSLLPAGLFRDPARFDADLAALDAALTERRLNHRLLQRQVILALSAWSSVAAR